MDHRDDPCAQKTRDFATTTTGTSRRAVPRLLTSLGLPLLLLLSYNSLAHPRRALARAESTSSWTIHQGTYRVAAISMDLPGQMPAPSVATIAERMEGNGDPVQSEASVQQNLAGIGVHLRIQTGAVDLAPAVGVDTTVCSEATVAYEYTRAVAHDPSVALADAVIIFTSHKTGCLSGGVTDGRVIELETPSNGWIDPRMIEHELGHSLLHLSHSGVTNTVDQNSAQQLDDDRQPVRPRQRHGGEPGRVERG